MLRRRHHERRFRAPWEDDLRFILIALPIVALVGVGVLALLNALDLPAPSFGELFSNSGSTDP